MGYYFELEPVRNNYFAETRVPTVFWALYALLGFALACMGTAAFGILSDLFRTGSAIDKSFLYAFGLAIAGYLVVGIKLAFVRKFVDFSDKKIRWGFKIRDFILWSQRVMASDISEIELTHSTSSPNQAPSLHNDRQYYAQGHWRVTVTTKSGETLILDRNTDREALEPLHKGTAYLCVPL